MTIEDLAGVVESLAEAVREGFVKADEKIDNLAMITQKGFLEVEKNMDDFKKEMFDSFIEVSRRFDHLEEIILEGHRQRIESLEDRIKTLEADFRSLVGKK